MKEPPPDPTLPDALLTPEAWSGRSVDFLQTHISWLFFVGDRVFKVKKPVSLGFLDFSTLELRHQFCLEEIRLNRRLAPDVYLGVLPIARDHSGQLRAGGPGETVDWAVEMHRLPSGSMLDQLLDRGEIDNESMNALASRLASFHGEAETGPGVDGYGTLEAVERLVRENLEGVRDLVEASNGSTLSTRTLQHLERTAVAFLRENASLLAGRVDAGRIRDGHGDLHAGNICYRAGDVIIYDCVEFSRRFRCGDVANDIAFLAMDLDARGFPGFARYLTHRYSMLASDPELERLLPFYKAYRATVRGKIATLAASQVEVPAEQRAAKRREARRYFHLAAAYDLPPALILMCGLPATGKTWLAREIGRPFGAAVHVSDIRRKQLAGVPSNSRNDAPLDDGLYTPENKRRTYRSLLEDSVRELEAGRTVVVDATFSKREYRTPFIDAAARLDHPFFAVHVHAPEFLIRQRLEQRARDPREASDAGLAVYLRARESFEPPQELPARNQIEFESGADEPEDATAALIDRLIEIGG